MGFSDLLSSSRGPGVIGTFVALIVLGGFGVLFVFVFDEGMQGGGATIESTIRHNADAIETSKQMVAQREADLEKSPVRISESKQADRLISDNASDAKLIEATQASRDQAQQAIKDADDALEAYKDTYRKSIRAAAVGKELPELKIQTGVTYKNVRIRLVDSVGMQIAHSEGLTRIGYKDLPPDMQDLYQFSKAQADDILKKEKTHFADNALDGKIADAQIAYQANLDKIQVLSKGIDTERATIQAIQTSTPARKQAIEDYRIAIRNESLKKISNAPQMEGVLHKMIADWDATRGSIPTREQTISRNQADIVRLKETIRSEETELKAMLKEQQDAQAAAAAKQQ